MTETEDPTITNEPSVDEFDDDCDDQNFLDALDPAESSDGSEKPKLTATQMARAEKNRLKALTLRKTRLMAHPYSGSGKQKDFKGNQQQKKLVDTGGGFFIEEGDDDEGKDSGSCDRVVHEPAPLLPHDQPTCSDCSKKFAESFLLRTFDTPVCDSCKDMSKDGDHELMAKTEAKSTFLLKDIDFEEGYHGPALRYLSRKNPHNPRGGDMKLYLRSQVEERALKVWGSEEALQAELDSREEKKVLAKTKKYEKKMKELRMAVRSSLYTKKLATHTHEYEDEIYHEDKDEYSQTCKTCGYIHYYEKI